MLFGWPISVLASSSIYYRGQLLDNQDLPIKENNISLRVFIKDKDLNCAFYKEDHSVNTLTSEGHFSLSIGKGSSPMFYSSFTQLSDVWGKKSSIECQGEIDGLVSEGDPGPFTFSGNRKIKIGVKRPGEANYDWFTEEILGSVPTALRSQVAEQLPSLGASNGQVLTWNSATDKWEPQTMSTGGSILTAGVGLNITGETISIATSGVTEPLLAPGSVGASQIKDGAVNLQKLVGGSLSSFLTDNIIQNSHLNSNVVNERILQIDSVTESKIANQAITRDKLADNSVTNAKIESLVWSKVSEKPTTLTGYGITDGVSTATLSSYAQLTGANFIGPVNFIEPVNFNGSTEFNSSLTMIGSNSIQLNSGSVTLNTGNLKVINGNVGIGIATPEAKLHIKGGAIVVNSKDNSSSNSINFSQSNTVTTSYSCSDSLNISNLIDGGHYTLVVTSTGVNQCNLSSGGFTFSYKPANGERTASSHTVYSLTVVGNKVYVTWVTGFN